jgi:hypothetical protein
VSRYLKDLRLAPGVFLFLVLPESPVLTGFGVVSTVVLVSDYPVLAGLGGGVKGVAGKKADGCVRSAVEGGSLRRDGGLPPPLLLPLSLPVTHFKPVAASDFYYCLYRCLDFAFTVAFTID